MSFYGEMVTETANVLQELGQIGQIVKDGISGGSPSDTTPGTPSPTTTDARMVVFPVATRRIDGTNIKAGDFQVIVEALGITIEADDTVICTEGTLKVVHPGKIAPAGTVVAYVMIAMG